MLRGRAKSCSGIGVFSFVDLSTIYKPYAYYVHSEKVMQDKTCCHYDAFTCTHINSLKMKTMKISNVITFYDNFVSEIDMHTSVFFMSISLTV